MEFSQTPNERPRLDLSLLKHTTGVVSSTVSSPLTPCSTTAAASPITVEPDVLASSSPLHVTATPAPNTESPFVANGLLQGVVQELSELRQQMHEHWTRELESLQRDARQHEAINVSLQRNRQLEDQVREGLRDLEAQGGAANVLLSRIGALEAQMGWQRMWMEEQVTELHLRIQAALEVKECERVVEQEERTKQMDALLLRIQTLETTGGSPLLLSALTVDEDKAQQATSLALGCTSRRQ